MYRSALIGAEQFPWTVPISKKHITEDLKIWRDEVEELSKVDKLVVGKGPRIEYTEINSKKFGNQLFPQKIVFDSIDDFMFFCSSESEWNQILEISKNLISKFPEASSWVEKNNSFKKILENKKIWDNLIDVCLYFKSRSPGEWIFAREIPLKISSKFIEDNKSILRELLDIILTPHHINSTASDFYKRYYLIQDHSRIRVRTLDKEVSIALFGTELITDFELIISELDNLLKLKGERIKKVFVVENLTTFLSFPMLQDSLVIFGCGRFATSIQIKSLSRVALYYWGDLDVQGLEIMAAFRKNHPNTIALLMDNKTYKAHSELIIQGEPTQLLEAPQELSSDERVLYTALKTSNNRLEQEKISRIFLENAFAILDY